jgi:hypothetical protein
MQINFNTVSFKGMIKATPCLYMIDQCINLNVFPIIFNSNKQHLQQIL